MEGGCVNKEELIEVLRQFDEKRVEELPKKTRNIFYAIMKIADERDELKEEISELEEYKKAIYEIKKYIDAYSPYFLETQEENNQTIAIIINNIGNSGENNE
jgi:predicted site-specific integrase-resolvase